MLKRDTFATLRLVWNTSVFFKGSRNLRQNQVFLMYSACTFCGHEQLYAFSGGKEGVHVTAAFELVASKHLVETHAMELQAYKTRGEGYYYEFKGSGYNLTINPDRVGQFEHLLVQALHQPCILGFDSDKHRQWWMYKDAFYWEDENLNEEQAKALILQFERKRARKLERAQSNEDKVVSGSANDRQSIPDDVKQFVWRRDGGHCVKCGNQENLEYDHIIPLSKGGSNTARNIQILCETCNRSKGDSIA